ncbi:LamG domain-containing protein [Candidatus Woesearchaeota archaeon]|nr:LamG domain-containing protein [Candidatus Woesearchaeota archaeon]
MNKTPAKIDKKSLYINISKNSINKNAIKENNKKFPITFILLLSLFLLLSTLAFAIPNSLTLQGKLTNVAGASQVGTFNFTFRIYDAATNGNVLYELANRNITTDANGIYDIILGQINLSFADQYYLGITVGTDSESEPRVNLTSAPYSFRANTSEALNPNASYVVTNLSVTGNITIGTGETTIEVSTQTFNLTKDGNIGLTNNITLGDRITFRFGQLIDNLVNGFLRVTGSLNVTGNVSIAQDTLFVDSANLRAGFGTTALDTRLKVAGDLNTTGTVWALGLNLSTLSTTAAGWTDDGSVVRLTTVSDVVGIGTPTPLSTLHVNGTGASGGFRVTNDSGYTAFFVNSTSGNVGIGTAGPSQKLHIDGNILLENNFGLRIKDASGVDRTVLSRDSANTLRLDNRQSEGIIEIIAGSGKSIDFYKGDGVTVQMRIADNGNVGINTTAPSQTLHVVGTLNVSRSTSAGDLFVDSSGSVGIGTTSPYNTLTVVGSVGVSGTLNASSINTTGNAYFATSSGKVGIGKTNPATELDVNGGINASTLNVSGNAYLATQSGNVGIGTTNPGVNLVVGDGTGQRYIDINAAAASQAALSFSKAGSQEWIIYQPGGSEDLRIYDTDSIGDMVTFKTGGNVGIGTTSPYNTLTVVGSVGVSGAINASSINVTGNAYFATSSGSVGIGTTSPSDKLHVAGAARIAVNDTNNISTTNVLTLEHFTQTPLNSTGGIGVGILLRAIDNGSNVDDVALINATLVNALNGSEASSLGFYTRTSGGPLTPRLFINGSNVGIGTTSPVNLLHISSASNAQGVRIERTGTTSGIWEIRTQQNEVSTDADLVIGDITNSRNVITFTKAAGNVGIGTVSPTELLVVAGNTNITGNLIVGADGSGKVGINTTSPNQALTVVGNANITGFVNITGDLDVRGSSITLGDASTDTIYTNGYFGTNIIPSDNSKDLGSPSNFWRRGYIDILTVNNLSVGQTNISGTTSPSFTINSNYTGNDDLDVSLIFERGTPTVNAVLLWDSTNKRFDMNFPLNIQSENNLTVDTNTLFVDGSVNRVGIGTSTPGTALHVVGTLNVSSDAYVGGNVGIGTTSPGSKLDVQGSVNVSGNIGLYDGGATRNLTFLWNPITGNEQVGITFARDADANVFARIIAPFYVGGGGLAFFTGNTGASSERMRIDNSGSVGIGTTSPNDILEVIGNVRVSGSLNATNINASRFYARNGTAAAPSYTFIEDTDTGIINNGLAGNNISIVTGGTARMTVDSSGNVGIGTVSPVQPLDLSSTYPVLRLKETDVTADNSVWYFEANAEIFRGRAINDADTVGNDWVRVERTGTTIDYVLFPNGLVGIGTTGPGEELEIKSATPELRFNDSDNSNYFDIGMSGTDFKIFSNDTSASGILIDQSGNVGIGTTSPYNTLTVVGSVGVSGSLNASSINTTGNAYFATSSGSVGVGLTNPNYLLQVASGTDGRSVNLSNVVYVNGSSGNVGIGTTSPLIKLQVGAITTTNGDVPAADFNEVVISDSSGIGGDLNNDAQIILHDDSSLGADKGGGILFKARSNTGGQMAGLAQVRGLRESATSGDLNGYLAFSTRGSTHAERMRITSSGNVGIGTTSPYNTLTVVGSISANSINATSINATERLIINNTLFVNGSRVGVVTSSPNSLLALSGGSADSAQITIDTATGQSNGVVMRTASTERASFGIATGTDSGVTGAAQNDFFIRSNQKWVLSANDGTTAHAVLTTSGNVGIGATNPAHKLTVAGSVNITGNISIGNSIYLAENQSLYQPVYGTDDDLVLYLPFSENAINVSNRTYDRSPYGNDGTLVKMNEGNDTVVNNTAWANGKYGYGMGFDGIDSYVDLGMSNFTTRYATIEAWIYPKNLIGTTQGIVTKSASSDNGFQLRIESSTIRWYSPDTTPTFSFLSSSSLRNNTWTYVVGTFDGSTAKIYLNGVLDASSSAAFTGFFSNGTKPQRILIGARDASVPDTPFNGIIDEVKIYKRALAAEEVRTHYLRGNSFGASGAITADRFRIVNTTGARILEINQSAFAVHTGGSERLKIDGNGNVGINQSNPSSRLHVDGTTNITAKSSTSFLMTADGNVVFHLE